MLVAWNVQCGNGSGRRATPVDGHLWQECRPLRCPVRAARPATRHGRGRAGTTTDLRLWGHQCPWSARDYARNAVVPQQDGQYRTAFAPGGILPARSGRWGGDQAGDDERQSVPDAGARQNGHEKPPQPGRATTVLLWDMPVHLASTCQKTETTSPTHW